jgi:VanZ family protein
MNRASRDARLRVLAPLALMALIFWSSAQSGGGDFPEWAHVLAHFTEYAALAALWLWALRPLIGEAALPAAATIAFLYAVSDEIHQSYVPGRVSDPFDVLVDTVGIAAALLVAAYARGRASTRRTQSQSDG